MLFYGWLTVLQHSWQGIPRAQGDCTHQATTTNNKCRECTAKLNSVVVNQIPYPHKRGPMGGAPYMYIGPRLGDGPIFEVQCISVAFRREMRHKAS